MPVQTARKLNISGAHAPIVNKEVHLHRSLNNGCIFGVQRVHRYHSTKFEKLHCITDWTGIVPAAGSGNFLTESYICLRRLENDVIVALSAVMKVGTEV